MLSRDDEFSHSPPDWHLNSRLTSGVGWHRANSTSKTIWMYNPWAFAASHDPISECGILQRKNEILCQDRKYLTVLALRLTSVFTYLCAEGPSTSTLVFHASNIYEHVPHVNSEAVAPYNTGQISPVPWSAYRRKRPQLYSTEADWGVAVVAWPVTDHIKDIVFEINKSSLLIWLQCVLWLIFSKSL